MRQPHVAPVGLIFGFGDADTEIPQIEEKFAELTARDDIAIIIINQWVITRPIHTPSKIV